MRKFILTFITFTFLTVSQVYSQQPYNPVALEHFKRSLEFLMIGDYYNAIISSNNVIRLDPNSAISYVVRARAYFEMNDYARVITDCTQAIRIDRNNAAAFTIRGNAYAQNSDFAKALSDWEAALRINPNISEAVHNIELAKKRQND